MSRTFELCALRLARYVVSFDGVDFDWTAEVAIYAAAYLVRTVCLSGTPLVNHL